MRLMLNSVGVNQHQKTNKSAIFKGSSVYLKKDILNQLKTQQAEEFLGLLRSATDLIEAGIVDKDSLWFRQLIEQKQANLVELKKAQQMDSYGEARAEFTVKIPSLSAGKDKYVAKFPFVLYGDKYYMGLGEAAKETDSYVRMKINGCSKDSLNKACLEVPDSISLLKMASLNKQLQDGFNKNPNFFVNDGNIRQQIDQPAKAKLSYNPVKIILNQVLEGFHFQFKGLVAHL